MSWKHAYSETKAMYDDLWYLFYVSDIPRKQRIESKSNGLSCFFISLSYRLYIKCSVLCVYVWSFILWSIFFLVWVEWAEVEIPDKTYTPSLHQILAVRKITSFADLPIYMFFVRFSFSAFFIAEFAISEFLPNIALDSNREFGSMKVPINSTKNAFFKKVEDL